MSQTPQAKKGDTVRVHYTGMLEDGTILESSRERNPLQLVVGAGQVITGFERAIEGMSPGDSKNINLPPVEAFGPRKEDMILELDRGKLSDNLHPQVGQEVQLHAQDGRPVPAVVTDVTASTVTVDANHPLAGKSLVFKIELMEIV